MELAILLSLAACFCTATASVCQRLGARNLDRTAAKSGGFDPWLVFRLARQPAWVLGLACMIGGFILQVGALHFGPLALVQPILAIELLFVFGYLALLPTARRSGPRVRWRDWLAVAVMCAGISVFLRAAAPSGGRDHAPAGLWWLAGGATLAAVAIFIALSERAGGSPTRRAAFLGIATGISWGFVAAVIKELSSHVSGGPAAIFTNWSAYVLMVTGAAGMLLASHAFAAGPLAASQPGFTILDPVTATLLGALLFSEQLATTTGALAAEAAGLLLLASGALALSRSDLIMAEAPDSVSTDH
ncbi:MAG TPA: DMT family transporter [Trebonia sp.]|jgi:drug/metabolite transporter (DMT)-like permease|nr:DMT family transporter [Trebonia sp.]